MSQDLHSGQTALIVGASCGLGYAMAAEFALRGWTVLGTLRIPTPGPLHELARQTSGRVGIEYVDVTVPEQIAALRSRLEGRRFDLLFVNAGVTNNPAETIGDVSTEEFTRVIVTNALGPMRVLETLYELVAADGTIGVMSSGQGSITNNTMGQREVYRASKAALNMLMRSFAARHGTDRHPMALIAPGWVRTDLGGPDAPLTIEQTVPKIVSILLNLRGHSGLQYLDYRGHAVPW